ncbi:hypothetical protein [Sulfolobus spindle-shaped virus]|nr:hypothetical protein [Sulfolobus spindle-shaped virus]
MGFGFLNSNDVINIIESKPRTISAYFAGISIIAPPPHILSSLTQLKKNPKFTNPSKSGNIAK